MKHLNTQFIISAVAFMCLITLIWYTVNFGWLWIVISYVYYKLIVGLLGNQIAQHRYFSHRSFTTTKIKERILYFLSLTTGVNPVFYATAHRHHHIYSDQPGDLHSVYNRWTDIFSPLTGRTSYSGNIKPAKVLNTEQRKINEHWPWIFLGYVAVAAALDWRLSAFAVLTGPAWNYLHMIFFRVWLVHVKLPGSYQTFDAGDRSWNNRYIQILDIGEGLHNNHHQYPNRYDQAVLPGEFDPAGWVVKKFFVN